MTTTTTNSVPTWTRADRLRKAREAAGYRPSQMADIMGVTRQTVTRWERGAKMTKASVQLWAHVTNVPAEWLETGTYTPSDLPETSPIWYRTQCQEMQDLRRLRRRPWARTLLASATRGGP